MQFKLKVAEVDETDALTDRYAECTMEWPTLPREGEIVWVAGNSFPIHEVVHEFDRSQIVVIFRCQPHDFAYTISLPGWKLL